MLGPSALAKESKSRIQQIPRYHLENYFLDAEVLAQAFSVMEPEGAWLRSASAIEDKLREFARSVVPYAVALNVNAAIRERVGNVSIMPKQLSTVQSADALAALIREKTQREGERVTAGLDLDSIYSMVAAEFTRLMTNVEAANAAWKIDLPGRVVLHKFASAAGVQPGRLKQLYLNAADPPHTFKDILDIFENFRREAA
jgi:hypothetical protein